MINKINDEYFGEDKTKNYLKDDFTRTLYGVIYGEVINMTLIEALKNQRNEEKQKDDDGNTITLLGNFDKDNASQINFISEKFTKGMMIDIRQLLAEKEQGAGGKFIDDILKLTDNDFIEYHKNLNPASTLTSGDTATITKNVKILQNNANRFKNSKYHDVIVRDYQSLKFHKDRQTIKYDMYNDLKEYGPFKFNITTRKDKAKVVPLEICKCLNDFSNVIRSYQKIVSNNTSFVSSNLPLEEYINKIFEVFAMDVSNDIKKQAFNNIKKNLKDALDLVNFQ